MKTLVLKLIVNSLVGCAHKNISEVPPPGLAYSRFVLQDVFIYPLLRVLFFSDIALQLET